MCRLVTNVKFLVILTLAITITVNFTGLPSPSVAIEKWEEPYDDLEKCTACPHEQFLERHVCPYCETLQDAATFSRLIRGYARRNTVLFGTPEFEVKTYLKNRCGNTTPVKIATCSLVDNIYYHCELLGFKCFCEHSTINGHIFFREIKCE